VSETQVEAAYRRWLRCYPRDFRREHAEELLGVLLAEAGPDCHAPRLAECLDLVRGGLSMRLRPRVPRSDRAGFAAVRLMYVAAVVQCVVAVTVLATTGAVHTRVLAAHPGYTAARWRAEMAGSFDPLVMVAGVAMVVLLWVAWCSGRGRRWARALFAANFTVTTYSLLHGLAGGSASYARTDLAAATVLWLIELVALAVIVVSEAHWIAASLRSGRFPNPNRAAEFETTGHACREGKS
jgi:hypothetical protein